PRGRGQPRGPPRRGPDRANRETPPRAHGRALPRGDGRRRATRRDVYSPFGARQRRKTSTTRTFATLSSRTERTVTPLSPGRSVAISPRTRVISPVSSAAVTLPSSTNITARA